MPKKPEVYSATASEEERNSPLQADIKQLMADPAMKQLMKGAPQRPQAPQAPMNVDPAEYEAALARQAKADAESMRRPGIPQGQPGAQAAPPIWQGMQAAPSQGQLVDPMAPNVADPIPLRGRGQFRR